MTYTARYAHLTAQRAYARRVAARGLVALLEPYTLAAPAIPAQRRRSLASPRECTVITRPHPVR